MATWFAINVVGKTSAYLPPLSCFHTFLPADLPAFPAPLHDLRGQGTLHNSRAGPTQVPQKGIHSSSGVTSAQVMMQVREERILPRRISIQVIPAVKSGWWEEGGREEGWCERRGFSYNDAGTLQGLFLNLLKCATPFRYCNLQLRLQTKTNREAEERERKWNSNNTSSSFLSLQAYGAALKYDSILLRCGAFRLNDCLAWNKNRVEWMIPTKMTWQHLKAATD